MTRENTKKYVQYISWITGILAVSLALIAWGSERLGGKMTVYSFFPLLGILAFSLMWSHYMAGAYRRLAGLEASVNKLYMKITSAVVLGLILLHPGLLIFQLYRDGFGLPPKSYLTVYGAVGMKLALMFGTISFIIFLLFDLKKRFYKKSWWKYIETAQILAMFFIFYHGLTLGRELSIPWYRGVWFFYGLSLISAVSYNYWYDRGTIKARRK